MLRLIYIFITLLPLGNVLIFIVLSIGGIEKVEAFLPVLR